MTIARSRVDWSHIVLGTAVSTHALVTDRWEFGALLSLMTAVLVVGKMRQVLP